MSGIRLAPRDRVHVPLAGHAFELVPSTVLEGDPGPGDEVLHGLRHEHLVRARKARDASAGVDGEPGDLAADELAFARVHTGPDLEPEQTDTADDRRSAPNRTGRTVERREEAVSRSVDLSAAEMLQLPAHE